MAATPALLEGSGVANPMAAVRDDFTLRVDAAWRSASQRRYERYVQYCVLDKDVRAQLIAIRRGHLIEYFSHYDKRTLMQLGIRWWREVRVCPALFDPSERERLFDNMRRRHLDPRMGPPSYLQLITSDRLDAMQQLRPLDIGNHAVRVTASVGPYVGYVVIDGHVFHES